MSTGTFPKDIVGLRFDRGICLRVYRHIFEVNVGFEFDRGICLHVYRPIFDVYVEFESTGTFLGFKLDSKVGFEMCLEIFQKLFTKFQKLFTKFQNSLYFHTILVPFVLCFGMLI